MRKNKLKEILQREPIYINPYTDFGFKLLFGEEANKDLLIDFLNQLLPPHHQIRDLVFTNNEKIPELEGERKTFFDISCISVTDEEFIIEMQKAKTKHFKDRSVFYVTFPIRRQAKRGKWNFKLAPVYFIAILDYEYDEDALKRELLRKVSLKDQNNEVFSETLNFIFLQMPLFNKKEDELRTRFDKWLFFLKNLETFEEIPQILNEPIFRKGFEIAKIAKMNLPELSRYERSRLALWEEQAVIDYAKEEGLEEGLEKGLEQGLQKSIKIISLLNQGHSIKETAKLADAPIDFVKKIAAELKIKS